MELTMKFLYQSNYWYNDGLKRAKVRDMSGAITSLKRSLTYNRDNITARNLLGLVYYGVGEVAEALTQWIISKNLKPSENAASYYIKMIQESPNELDNCRQAIHKYNQCLVYCRQNGEDLAIIQLKKVIAGHPAFLKAYQLLALLYIHGEQYTNARQVLRKAHRLDNTNSITLSYMYELNKVRKKNPVKIKEPKPQTISYNVGNETIIQPANTDSKEKARIFTLLNLVIGIVIGVAIIWFLVIPAINQSSANETNQDIIAYGEEIASQKAEISALKQELETYRAESDETEDEQETAVTTQSSYEKLMQVQEQYESNSVSNADMAANLMEVNSDSLGEQGQAIYTTLTEAIYPTVLSRNYSDGKSSYEAENYQDAITSFESVIKMQTDYEDGKALLYLANSYALTEETDRAAEIYDQIIQLLPDTDVAAKAQQGIDGTVPDIESTEE
ncbi:MAG: tetratricopeptide repeat protein [Lachnospiraceae bacterium]